jgi:hypothetical protein
MERNDEKTWRSERPDCQKRYLALAAQKGLFQAAKKEASAETNILSFMLLACSAATRYAVRQYRCPALRETPYRVWRNARRGADKFLLQSAGLVPVDNVDELPRILIELKLELSLFVND